MTLPAYQHIRTDDDQAVDLLVVHTLMRALQPEDFQQLRTLYAEHLVDQDTSFLGFLTGLALLSQVLLSHTSHARR